MRRCLRVVSGAVLGVRSTSDVIPAVETPPVLTMPVQIPKGFAPYYPGTTDWTKAANLPLATAYVLDEAIVTKYDEHLLLKVRRGKQKQAQKVRNRILLLVGMCGIVAVTNLWGLYQPRITGSGSDAKGLRKILNDYGITVTSLRLSDHTATLITPQGTKLDVTFVDAAKLEAELEGFVQDGSWPHGLIYIAHHAYFPALAIGMLFIIPLLMYFNASVVVANKLTSKAMGDKKTFKFRKDTKVGTRLGDVAGLTEAKTEVTEIVDFLKNPGKYQALGARLPTGVMLDGPPGVGKTMLARAVAGEAGVPFISCSGSEFEEVFVGVGASRIRKLFKEARANSPCVVFVDEIDAFGKKRHSSSRGSSSRGTINAFLSEMDGFSPSTGVVVLAATNRMDVLDPALTRAGRFDRKITLERPPYKDRIQISKVHLKPLRLDPSLLIDDVAENLAAMTPGCTGADIKNICNEAAIIATRNNLDSVSLDCFHKASERVLVGLERKARVFSSVEKRRIALHEAGHAIFSWYLRTVDPVIKVSIVPRGGAGGGVTQKLPKETYIVLENELQERIIQLLGGFVAEEHFFEDVSTSAAEDLQKATDKVQDIVAAYGMCPKTVGHFNYRSGDRENAITKPYGMKKQDTVDNAVTEIMEALLFRARALLKEHIMEVRIVAGLLNKFETLTAQELWVLLGDRTNMTKEFRALLEAA